MAEMGDGYGSECHLLRYLGRHREQFNKRVCAAVGADSVRWLDFHFDPTKRWKDGERKGLDFLADDHPASIAWRSFWPQRGNQPNWDAVGVANTRGKEEWILVEAKAHVGEMISNCQASENGGLPTIRAALDEVKRKLGVPLESDWLHRYYQFANRLVILNFLLRNGVSTRLLFVYFIGDRRDDVDCPQTEEVWEAALLNQTRSLGLAGEHSLSNRISKLFLPVSGEA